MNKILAVSIIAVLYLSPLAVFAQRRKAGQDQPGKYQAEYKYDAADEITETNPEDSNFKSFSRHSTTTVHAQFQSSELVTVRHTNFISIINNLTPQASGTCSITYSGEEHHVTKDSDLHYDATEQSAFSGTVTEANGIGIDFPDTGDTPQSADASAKGTGSGFYKKTSQDESFYYENGLPQKKKLPPEIDTNCNESKAVTGLVTGGVGGDADSTKPPEKACSGTFEMGAHIFTRQRNADDANDGRFFGEAALNGSFAAGQYKMSLTTTAKPVGNNKTESNLTETMTETLTFSVTLLIGGAAVAETFAPISPFEPIVTAETLMPDDKWRISLRQSKI